MKLETLLSSLYSLTTGVITPFTAMQRHVKRPANLLILFLAVQAFFACTRDDDPSPASGGELQISVTAAGYASSDPGAPETRTADDGYATAFAIGDQIGVTVLDGSNPTVPIPYNNIPYRFDGTKWAPSGADRAYIPSGTAGYLVYYPYSPTMNGKKTEAEIIGAFSVPVDQGDQGKYAASDLMTAMKGSIVGNTLNVTLTHSLAMLEINLSTGAGNASVQVDAGGVISPWNIAGTTWRCLVKPAAGAIVSGSHIAYATKIAWQQAGVTLEAGKYTRLNVANSASTIEGYTGEIKVIYSDNNEVTIPASDIRWLESGKIVKSITLSGKTHLIGRAVDPDNLIKLKFDGNGDLVLRAPVDGSIPIGSYAEFQKISGNGANKKYRQEADLDLMDEEWTPIVISGQTYFNGEFDGAGKQISNLKISVSGEYRGLFSRNQGTIRDVHIVSGEIKAAGSDRYIGGICGGNASNGQIISCSNAATVSGSSFVGGVSGDNSGTVTACCNTGTVSGTGSNVGGVSGGNSEGVVTACYNTGGVSGTSTVGGVSGDNIGTGAVTACYNTGSVSGTSYYVGGVVGGNGGAVTACYNTGAVKGTSNVGSVVGYNIGTFTACYWKSGTATRAVGNQVSTTGATSFPDYFDPGTGGEWGTGTGGTNGWWKAGTTDGSHLPQLWYE